MVDKERDDDLDENGEGPIGMGPDGKLVMGSGDYDEEEDLEESDEDADKTPSTKTGDRRNGVRVVIHRS